LFDNESSNEEEEEEEEEEEDVWFSSTTSGLEIVLVGVLGGGDAIKVEEIEEEEEGFKGEMTWKRDFLVLV
jgi:hypothetical protein